MTHVRPTGGARRFPTRAAGPAPRRFNGGCRTEPLEGRVLLATFTVTTVADDGPGSLRRAILDANSAAGADTIGFAIPGPAGTVHAIRPLSPLPGVSDPTTLDATTQPGYAGLPLVELDGSLAGALTDGLTVTSGPSVVRGLAINRFSRHGVWVGAPGTRVEACHVGVTPAGDRAAGNGAAGVRVAGDGAGVVVGGTSAAQRNVISANGRAGVLVTATGTFGTGTAAVVGNYIGTDAAGAARLGNRGEGVLVTGDRASVNVGNRLPSGVNVISGNDGSGVRVSELATAMIQGNRIGTDAAGTAALGNGGHGVELSRAGSRGGVVTGNLISANGGSGVWAHQANIYVGGNYIGTDVEGARPLGNAANGIELRESDGSIGGTLQRGLPPDESSPDGSVGIAAINPRESRGNIISANGRHGVYAVSSGVLCTNNYVGTDVTGSARLGNGGDGVRLEGAMSSRWVSLGIVSWNPGNVISANGGNGVTLLGATTPQDLPFMEIRGNRIGTDRTGALPLGNAGHGVAVLDSDKVIVGAFDRGRENTIAFNGGSGIHVRGTVAGAGPALASILGNSVFSNGGLGIDNFAPDDAASGVTPNDPGDADTGPNDLQNYPVIDWARSTPSGATVVRYTLDAERNRSYLVSFFSSPAPDPSGHGEGRTYLGGVFVTVGGGPVTATAQVDAAPAGSYVTAIASKTGGARAGATSEFSPAVVTVAAPVPRVTGRYLFYNDSAFDGRSPAADGADDAAVAADKRALLPGQAGSFANVTSYDKGINGVMIDLADLPPGSTPTLGDFAFRTGAVPDTSRWEAAPAASDFQFRRGAGVGGSDRVSITWPAASMRNTWLEVTVRANERTGLAEPDVFYFGNLVGECAGPPGPLMYVSPADWAATRSALNRTAGVTHRYDHNRDGQVSPADLGIVRSNLQRSLIAPPPAPAPPALTAYAPASEAGTIREELLIAELA